MNDEEITNLIQEMSEQIDQLPDDSEKPLSKEDRTRKIVLRAKVQALKKIQTAKEKGSLFQEVRASVDYTLLCKYGEKHPFLMYFFKSQMGWWGF